VLAIHRLLADAGYDAEHNHALCREQLGIRSTVIRVNPRRYGRRWPKTHYRRQMRRRFPKRKYRQRWQVESTFSQHKRRLGAALTARSDGARAGESLLRALTHNLMILRYATKGFQQSKTVSVMSRPNGWSKSNRIGR
jgi:transposase